jgi:hypothetical protein
VCSATFQARDISDVGKGWWSVEERAKPKIAGARKEVGIAPVAVIIPVCNEEGAIGRVIDALPEGWFDRVVVAAVDPIGYTAQLARKFGATVVPAHGAGYGAACRAGIDFLRHLGPEEQPEAVVFLNADFSADPQQLPLLLCPILKKRCDLVIGSRFLKRRPAGAMPIASVIGAKMTCIGLGLLCFQKHTDVGPFRAVSWKSLQQMRLANADETWAVEMQMQAARMGLMIGEVAVDCRATNKTRAIGASLRASAAVAMSILRHAFSRH